MDSLSEPEAIEGAADRFYEITVRHREWPYAWLGLGLAKLRLHDIGAREVVSPHQPAGAGWLAGALSAFEAALRLEPAFGRAIAGVAEVYRREPIGATGSRAAGLLQAFARDHELDLAGTLALARFEEAREHWPRAEILITGYLAAGGDSGVAAWESAVIAFGQGQITEGGRSYYRAAATEAARGLVRENLALIASREELQDFDATPAAKLPAYLERLWSGRELRDGRPRGSRLAEHFRRIRYAREHFATGARIPVFGFEQVYRDAPPGLDDRGAIYIRHGEPDERASYVGDMSTPPNESWSYFRPEGPLVLHFAALGPGGYRLLENLAAIGGDLAALYESRAGLGTEFLTLSNLYEIEAARRRARITDPGFIPPEALERERRRSRAMIMNATSTDSDPLELERSWAPVVQVFGIAGSTRGAAGLLVVVALPTPSDLDAIDLGGGAKGYVVRLRTTSAGEAGGVLADSGETIRVRSARSLRAGESLVFVRFLPTPPGEQRVRVIVSDSTERRGAVRIVPGVPVIELSDQQLTMSDLVTGTEGSATGWTRPDGLVVELDPRNAWRRQDVATIAFDVGGLQPGEAFKVRLGIGDLGADSTAPPKTSVEFSRVADGEREFVTQSVALRTLRPGRYLLTATVTVGDRIVQRSRRITIVR